MGRKHKHVPISCCPLRSVPSPRQKVVGNTYTTAEERPSKAGSDSTEVWVEMGLRVEDIRVRCVFQYDRDRSGASFKRVFLVREGLERLPLDDGEIEVKYPLVLMLILPCVVLFWFRHRRLSLSRALLYGPLFFRFKRMPGRGLRQH